MNRKDQTLINKATKELTRDDMAYLKAHFVRLYKRRIPKWVSPTFLHGNVAWGLQAEAQGHDPIKLRQKLVAQIQKTTSRKAKAPSTGTQLIREWKGNTYLVTKTKEGYRYNNKTYKSLTPIAQLITSNHISGPKFFGLTKKPSEK